MNNPDEDGDEIPTLVVASEPEDLVTSGPVDKRVPVTLICGFLGAGKSTLLRWILTGRHGYRIAVIMNEFSDTADIEAKAIKVSSAEGSNNLEQASEEFLELANGCLCCSIKDSGVAAIEKLMSRKGAFDHILLETTGLADPGPIAAMFWQNEEFAQGLGKDIFLDGVVCVIDAVFAEKQIHEDTASEGIKHSLRQIAAADVLLLNKADLVTEAEVGKTESMLRSLNPSIPIYRTVRAQVDLSKIMGIHAYGDNTQALLENVPEDGQKSHSDHQHGHRHQHEAHPSPNKKHDGISSIVTHISGPLNESQTIALDEWIRSVLWDNQLPYDPGSSVTNDSSPESRKSSTDSTAEEYGNDFTNLEVLRCKGLWWNEKGEQFVLQGVRNLYEVSKTKVDAVDSSGTFKGKLVFIGKGLGLGVEDSLRRLIAK